MLDGYPSLRDVVWLQEEPENMGAWEFMRPLLEELIGDRYPLRYIGRARSASPSEGSSAWHQLNQRAIVERAFDLDSHPPTRRGSVDGAVEGSPEPRPAPRRTLCPTSSSLNLENRSSRRVSRRG